MAGVVVSGTQVSLPGQPRPRCGTVGLGREHWGEGRPLVKQGSVLPLRSEGGESVLFPGLTHPFCGGWGRPFLPPPGRSGTLHLLLFPVLTVQVALTVQGALTVLGPPGGLQAEWSAPTAHRTFRPPTPQKF